MSVTQMLWLSDQVGLGVPVGLELAETPLNEQSITIARGITKGSG